MKRNNAIPITSLSTRFTDIIIKKEREKNKLRK
jgi:hypothetical protein